MRNDQTLKLQQGEKKKKNPASYSPDTDRVQLQLWTPFHLQQLSLKELQSGRVDEESARFIHSFIKVRAVNQSQQGSEG